MDSHHGGSHTLLSRYLEEQDLPYTVFQPLYLYGEHTGKDCEQWFMDRVLRCQLHLSPKHSPNKLAVVWPPCVNCAASACAIGARSALL